MFARVLVACVLVTVLAGCGAGPSLFGPSTGSVTGHVQLRACGGAYRAEQTACPTHPYAGVTLRFTPTPAAASASDHAVTTDSSGWYRIDLKPGSYSVRASGPGDPAGGFGGPREVVVSAGKTVTADFVYTIQLL
ncbi:MAG TPA: carboxypeptidase-like regulatory domain-containing protein [Candidatus Dormibacteraeota bacterium]